MAASPSPEAASGFSWPGNSVARNTVMSVMTGMPAGNLGISTPGPSRPPALGGSESLF